MPHILLHVLVECCTCDVTFDCSKAHAISNKEKHYSQTSLILFGHQNSYGTHCSDCFANPYTYQLSWMMKYFHSSTSTWWNDADSKIKFPPNVSHYELVNCVKSMYLRCALANDVCVYIVLFCIVLCCIYMFNSSGKEEQFIPIT